MTPSLTRRAAGIVVGLAAMVVIVAVTVAVFFNPVYVAFEQDRAQAAAWTGYTPEDVHAVTNSVLGQLYFGPATFDQAVSGQTVFDARERAHLADVRGVLLGLGVATFIALLALIA